MTTNILLTLPPWLAYAIARDAIVLWEKIANSPTAGITITVFGVLASVSAWLFARPMPWLVNIVTENPESQKPIVVIAQFCDAIGLLLSLVGVSLLGVWFLGVTLMAALFIAATMLIVVAVLFGIFALIQRSQKGQGGSPTQASSLPAQVSIEADNVQPTSIDRKPAETPESARPVTRSLEDAPALTEDELNRDCVSCGAKVATQNKVATEKPLPERAPASGALSQRTGTEPQHLVTSSLVTTAAVVAAVATCWAAFRIITKVKSS